MNFELYIDRDNHEWIFDKDGDVGDIVCDSPKDHFKESIDSWHSKYKHLILVAPEMMGMLEECHSIFFTMDRRAVDEEVDIEKLLNKIKSILNRANGL